jgi:hypothetical protein
MEDLLKNWYEAKEDLAKLETKIKDYKSQADVLLKNSKEAKTKDFVLEVKEMSRRMISKDDMTDDDWLRFSRAHKYKCYYVYKAGEKKRSPRRSPAKK